jgi:hypothetical protein
MGPHSKGLRLFAGDSETNRGPRAGEVYLVGGPPQAAFRYPISAPCTEPV